MAILKPDKAATLGSVTVNEYLLTKHNPNRIIMLSASMEGKIIGVITHRGLQPHQVQPRRSSIREPLSMGI